MKHHKLHNLFFKKGLLAKISALLNHRSRHKEATE
jgi:hypothetical protein